MAQVVESFSLRNVQTEKSFNLNDQIDKKLVVVLFFSNDCAFTDHYIDRVRDLNKYVVENGSILVLVNSNSDQFTPKESVANMKKFLTNNRLEIPYLADKDKAVAQSFGARRTPEAYVLTFENKVPVIKYKGAIDDNALSAGDVGHSFLKDAIGNLLANKKVTVSSTRANGCLIK